MYPTARAFTDPVVALVLVLAGCGDDATSPDAADSAAELDTRVEVQPEVLAPVPLPALQVALPADGTTSAPSSLWWVLTFGGDVSASMLEGFSLSCDGADVSLGFDQLGGGSVVVNPVGALPPEASCVLAWPGPGGEQSLSVVVAAAGALAVMPYDRDDRALVAPMPDDVLLVDDASSATGRRVSIPVPDRPDDVKAILTNIAELPSTLDGWSPLAPLVIELPASVDPATLPTTEAASLDPLAAIGLYDIDPTSPTYLQRHAFDIYLKEEPSVGGVPAHVWVIFPTAPLTPRGRYALVVTRRALVDASRPLAPSAYMQRALADATSPAGEALARLALATPAVRADDVALLLSISIRSIDHVPDDMLAIRAAVRAAPPPAFVVTEVAAGTQSVAAIVKGTWQPPKWRNGNYLARDADGAPMMTGHDEVPFILALPVAALTGPVPIVIYAHGNPGSAQNEVPFQAATGLAAAGFAVIGFTNIQNREITKGGDVALSTAVIFSDLLANRRFPDIVAALDIAEMLSFIRMVPALAELDVLPLDAADGVPDLASDEPLMYLGISHGSHVGTGVMPYAPEIAAAALIVGGGRWSSTVVHQESSGPFASQLYAVVTSVFPNVTRAELWVGISLSQMGVDRQDWGMHARWLYRDKLPLGDARRPSLLVVEGLNDVLVPAHSTRCAAASFGIPQLEPVAERVPFLASVAAPVRGNIDATTTAAFVQYVPPDVPGIPMSAGCDHLDEGHSCAQANPSARALRVAFFKSAQLGVPVIDPGAIVVP